MTVTAAQTATKLIADLEARVEATDTDLIGRTANVYLPKVKAALAKAKDLTDLGEFGHARWEAEDLVDYLEEWVVDEEKALPTARELRDILDDLAH